MSKFKVGDVVKVIGYASVPTDEGRQPIPPVGQPILPVGSVHTVEEDGHIGGGVWLPGLYHKVELVSSAPVYAPPPALLDYLRSFSSRIDLGTANNVLAFYGLKMLHVPACLEIVPISDGE